MKLNLARTCGAKKLRRAKQRQDEYRPAKCEKEAYKMKDERMVREKTATNPITPRTHTHTFGKCRVARSLAKRLSQTQHERLFEALSEKGMKQFDER